MLGWLFGRRDKAERRAFANIMQAMAELEAIRAYESSLERIGCAPIPAQPMRGEQICGEISARFALFLNDGIKVASHDGSSRSDLFVIWVAMVSADFACFETKSNYEIALMVVLATLLSPKALDKMESGAASLRNVGEAHNRLLLTSQGANLAKVAAVAFSDWATTGSAEGAELLRKLRPGIVELLVAGNGT